MVEAEKRNSCLVLVKEWKEESVKLNERVKI